MAISRRSASKKKLDINSVDAKKELTIATVNTAGKSLNNDVQWNMNKLKSPFLGKTT